MTISGLVSYLFKEKLFMSEALLATVAGIIFGPRVLGWFNPLEWVGNSESGLNDLTFQITRVVIGIQVLFTGIALPKAYLKKEWVSLTTLLLPIMTAAWFVTSLLIWGLIPGLTFLECLVIGACVTPTDPVLANSICKGRFAEKHVPIHVRNIIVAESGANDGLGYPFLWIALYLILIKTPDHHTHTIGGAIGEWIYNIVLYQIVVSCIAGAVVGYLARKVLRFCHEKSLIDHESLLSFGVALTFFIQGVVGMLGSDDILCCFVAGNSFSWDDWTRIKMCEDESFQDVIDQLLSTVIFLYIGAIMPWDEFGNFYTIDVWRLVVLGLLVMLVRRLPWVIVLAKFKWIPALPTFREAAFAGFFGPIGVGAVFYVAVTLESFPDTVRPEMRALLKPIVYFLVLTSVIVHGITIPFGKGFQRARTLTITRSLVRSQSKSTGNDVSRLPPPVPVGTARLPASDLDIEANPQTPGILSRRPSRDGESNGQAIRFADLQRPLNGDVDSPFHTPPQSRPISRRASMSPSRAQSEAQPEQEGGAAGHMTEWREGHWIVSESADGETVLVERGTQ